MTYKLPQPALVAAAVTHVKIHASMPDVGIAVALELVPDCA